MLSKWVALFILLGMNIPLEPVVAFLQQRNWWDATTNMATSSAFIFSDRNNNDDKRAETARPCTFTSMTTFTTTTTTSWSRIQSCLFMGKGDGKKRRKKKSSNAGGGGGGGGGTPLPAPPPSSASLTPSPMRVTSNSNIPVRHQIRWAKLNKEYRNQVGAGFRQKRVVRTKYRRSWDEQEVEIKAAERKRKGQDPDWDVILNRTASSPLVIVDGYNIIYQWARLKKHMVKGDPARARQLLVEDLEDLRLVKRWRIEVVFDGTKKSSVGPLGHGPGSSDRPTRIDQTAKLDVSKHGVRVVFSGVGQEADAYIEARCAAAKNVTKGRLTGQLIVASDDSMIRIAGTNAGAMCMSADRFVSELKALRKAVEYRVHAAMAKVNGEMAPAQDRPVRFGRRSVLLEDKRNRTKAKKQAAVQEEEELELNLQFELETDENGIPWWAQLPNTTVRCT